MSDTTAIRRPARNCSSRPGSRSSSLWSCSGEVRAFAGPGEAYKVVALMQATVANVKRAVSAP